MNVMIGIGKRVRVLIFFIAAGAASACKDTKENPVVPDPPKNTLEVNPSTVYQEMVGFGGGLTWYCDRITRSTKKSEISQLLFNDLGTDIIRLKNWYYPTNYPTNKANTTMEVDWFKPHFDATNELYTLAKGHNPAIKVLLSSWGPPSNLKSNAKLGSGTLKSDGGGFMYDAFATYWTDILDNISFNPDYLSIQNEPSFVTDEWATCQWSPLGTTSYPSYATAADKVYDQIKNRTNPPLIIGPEAENIGGTTFTSFADAIKSKPYLSMYCYHIYNYNENLEPSQLKPQLNIIRSNYSNKPNIMTEFSKSAVSWFKTARLINTLLVEGNAAGYIYWEMMWDQSSTSAMIKVDEALNYQVTPYYYSLKHFSKNIDAGYKRIGITFQNSSVEASAFINPAQNKITLILFNTSKSEVSVNPKITDKTIQSMAAYQSVENDYFKSLQGVDPANALMLPPLSVTTVVLDIQ